MTLMKQKSTQEEQAVTTFQSDKIEKEVAKRKIIRMKMFNSHLNCLLESLNRKPSVAVIPVIPTLTWEAEVGGLRIPNQPVLHSDSLS
jgi:hypothetical protein